MKTTAWVNVGSIVVFTLSFTAWIFLVNDYLNTSSTANTINSQTIEVRGAHTEVKEQTSEKTLTNEKKEQSILEDVSNGTKNTDSLEDFIEQNTVIPKKKEGVGKTYVRAKAAVAIDVDSRKVLFDQHSQEKMPIASLTKLMTALVVIDNIKNLKSTIVTVDRETCNTPTSIIGCPSSTYCISDTLHIGEKVRANDLLEAMLVNSANDAAVALGNHISGSQNSFAELMNKKAKEIGLKNTNFCNPSGLDDEESAKSCYSSAEDVAKIVVYALKNDKYKDLWRIFKIKERWFNSVDGKAKHKYATTNILLESMSNCEGAKTGFTYEAGKTLMMIASHPQNKNRKVVAVILNDPYRFEDVQKLFDWTFENYQWGGIR